MGELYLDNIDKFLLAKHQNQLKKLDLPQETIDEEYNHNNIIPDCDLQIESSSGRGYTTAS